VDRTWRTANGVTFTFHPENEADARSHIVGLIPYLNNSINNPCSLKQFSKEARLWHVTSKWDPEMRQAYTAKEAELDNFLDDDDELNLTDEILSYRPTKTPDIQINVQRVADPENMLPMYNDTDSFCTFHPVTPPLHSFMPSARFSPKTISSPTTLGEYNLDSVSKMMDSESRKSSLEYKFNTLRGRQKKCKNSCQNSFLPTNRTDWQDISVYPRTRHSF